MHSYSSLFVTAGELALEAGVSIRTIQSWAKSGYFGKSGHNRYDLIGYYRWQNHCLNQELTSLKEVALDWDAKWREGRARKSLAEAKLVELQLQKLAQSLLLRDVVAFELDKILSASISAVRSLPNFVYRDLVWASTHPQIKNTLDAAVTDVLARIQSQLKGLRLPSELIQQCDSFQRNYSSDFSSETP